MKKALLTIFVLALAASAGYAQTEKGSMYISGNIGINGGSSVSVTNSGNNEVTTKSPGLFSLYIAPQFGYFFADGWEVNGKLGYDLVRTNNGNTFDGDNLYNFNHLFTITPGISYHLRLADRFYYTPGFDLSLGFGVSKTQESKDVTRKNYGITAFSMSLSVFAFEFLPSEHFGITLSAGDLTYALESHRNKGNNITTTNTTNDVNFDINMGALIGFRYYF